MIPLSNCTAGEVSHLQEKQEGFLLQSSLLENILITQEIPQLYGSSIYPRYIPVKNDEGGFTRGPTTRLCVALYWLCILVIQKIREKEADHLRKVEIVVERLQDKSFSGANSSH